MSNQRNLSISFTNINPLNNFPATSFQLIKIGSDTVINFYFSDGSQDPDDCLSIVLTKASITELVTRGSITLEKAEISKEKKEKYSHLQWKEKKAIRSIPPKRINAFGIGSINDVIDISCGYIHPLLVTPLEENNDSPTNLLIPLMFSISISIDLFIYLLLSLQEDY